MHEGDLVARFGGDKFAILRTSHDDQRESAVLVANRIRDVITAPYQLETHRVSIATSIGIALAPAHGTEVGALLKRADLALSLAKSEGCNQYRLFEAALEDQAQARLALEVDCAGAHEAGPIPGLPRQGDGRRRVGARERPLAALEPDRAAWRRLSERAAEPNVFYDPAFAMAAAPALGARVQAALLWTRTQPRQLLGFFPVRGDRRYGPLWPAVTGWTHPFAPLGTPLVDRDAADEVIDAFLTGLAGTAPSPPLLLWPFIAEHGPFAAALDRVLAVRRSRSARFGAHHRAVLAPGKQRADYLKRALSPKRRKELARLRRRLAVNGTLRLVTACTEAEVTSSLAEFLALEAKGCKGRAGTAIACDPGLGRFVSAAVAALAATSMARIDRLLLDGRTLAAAITLQHGAAAWFWKIAFDEGYARCSPGVQLTIDITAALLDDARTMHVDSCAGGRHPMIDHLWRERMALCDRLIAVDPDAALAFSAACRLEAWRR